MHLTHSEIVDGVDSAALILASLEEISMLYRPKKYPKPWSIDPRSLKVRQTTWEVVEDAFRTSILILILFLEVHSR